LENINKIDYGGAITSNLLFTEGTNRRKQKVKTMGFHSVKKYSKEWYNRQLSDFCLAVLPTLVTLRKNPEAFDNLAPLLWDAVDKIQGNQKKENKP